MIALFRIVPLLALAAGTFSVGILGCGNSEPTATNSEPTVSADAQKSETKPATKPTPAKVTEVRYENTRSGLARLMRNLRVSIEGDIEPSTVSILRNLRLGDPESWMKKTFGDDLGKILATDYVAQSEEIGLLAQLLKEQFALGRTEILVEEFQTADAPEATGYQDAAIKKMKNPIALYSVRFRSKDGTKSFHLWSFVHDRDSFRYVGKMKEVAEKNIVGGRDLGEFRIRDGKRITSIKK